jgi:hypothetical protein
MSLADLADIRISASTVTPSRASFGVPLVAAYHELPGAAVQAFRSLAEAEEAGITAADYPVLHGILSALFAQRLRPPVVKVGRRTDNVAQALRLTPSVTTEGFVYKLTVDGEELTYTVEAAATATTIADALEELIEGVGTGITATPGAGFLDLAPAAGETIAISSRSKELRLEDRSAAAASLAADLSAFELEDSDFYGVLLDLQSSANIVAAAAWAETRTKLLVVRTADYAATDGASTTDVLSLLEASSYARTVPMYHPDVGAYPDAGWLSERLTADPGSDSWAFKRLAGVSVYRLTGTEEAAIKAKNGNVYTSVAGIPMTRWGVSAAGEYADVTRGIDWFQARLGERVAYVLSNNPKIPYTDAGVDVLRGEILAQLEEAQNVGFVAPTPAPVVTAIPVADVSVLDRAARNYPGLSFEAQLAGAIHKLTIRGTLRV